MLKVYTLSTIEGDAGKWLTIVQDYLDVIHLAKGHQRWNEHVLLELK